MADSSLIAHNTGGADQFQYQVTVTKADGSQTFGLGRFASELNYWESIFSKVVAAQVGLVDGAGLIDGFGIQTGDTLTLTMLVTENDEKKLSNVALTIVQFAGGDRLENNQGRTYQIAAVDPAGVKSLSCNVMKSYTGTISDIVSGVCADSLSISANMLDVETTTGSRTVNPPSIAPWRLIDWCCKHAVNQNNSPDSNYLFFQNGDGYHFKTVRKIVGDATTYNYTVGVDKNQTGDITDITRIIDFAQRKVSDQATRQAHGMLDNELLQFNHKNRTITSNRTLFQNAQQSAQVIATQSPADIDNNVVPFQPDANSSLRGISTHVRVRGDDGAYGQQNTFETKFGVATVQTALLNQMSFSLTLYGNAAIRAGDIINITSPDFSAAANKEQDYLLHGSWLVGNLRNQIKNGEIFRTFVDVFKDGFETQVMSNPGQGNS